MKYADIKPYDIANGPWVRVSFFASWCRHCCPWCFNAEAWDFDYGDEFCQKTIDDVIECLRPDYISGLTLLWGEPLAPENQADILDLIYQVRSEFWDKKSIWCFSGFKYEFIEQYMVGKLPWTGDILNNIDVLVDGRRVEDLKDLNLRFRGSSNQRVIDIHRTRKSGEIVRALGEVERERWIEQGLFGEKDVKIREKKIVELVC